MFEELNAPIEHVSLIAAIKQLNTNKSGGPDKILNEFLIHRKDLLYDHLLKLFNKLFEIGYFPHAWLEGYIVPLNKKGNLNDENNLRGITLLSVIGKLFTRILNNILTDWAEK